MDADLARRNGERLRDFLAVPMAREGVGSYAELARRAGLRANTITDWWAVGKVPGADSLSKIGRVISVRPGQLQDVYDGRQPAEEPEPAWIAEVRAAVAAGVSDGVAQALRALEERGWLAGPSTAPRRQPRRSQRGSPKAARE